jgi:hypothetical protein
MKTMKQWSQIVCRKQILPIDALVQRTRLHECRSRHIERG